MHARDRTGEMPMAHDRYGRNLSSWERNRRARTTSIFEQLGPADQPRRRQYGRQREGRADNDGAPDRGHYGAEHGYGGFQGDYGGGDDQGGFGGQGDYRYGRLSFSAAGRRSESAQDQHYRVWRERQLAELDRDYAEYRRERQRQFDSDFESWRRSRAQSSASVQGRESQPQGEPAGAGAPIGSAARPDAGTATANRGRGRTRWKR